MIGNLGCLLLQNRIACHLLTADKHVVDADGLRPAYLSELARSLLPTTVHAFDMWSGSQKWLLRVTGQQLLAAGEFGGQPVSLFPHPTIVCNAGLQIHFKSVTLAHSVQILSLPSPPTLQQH